MYTKFNWIQCFKLKIIGWLDFTKNQRLGYFMLKMFFVLF